ncbi:MAG: cell division topological specificity factor MinE [Defluviitaleaceae bacterium]|nr:cell division topological specificity factor MinE [Defluviitaleaceae bacterium]
MDLLRLLSKKENSKTVAKERLKLVLITDRINCSEAMLEALREDIIGVISKYMEIDTEGFDVQITPSADDSRGSPVLYANIPIKNMKR